MCLLARHIFPIAAVINATTKNVKPVKNKSPPVRKKTTMAARAAMGKANKKPKTTMIIKPIIRKMISNHKSCVGSVGTTTCKADKKADKKFAYN